MAAPVPSGGTDPDEALSSGAPGPHELALDSVLQSGTTATANPLLQVLQFGGGS